jgi:hypothetical protein
MIAYCPELVNIVQRVRDLEILHLRPGSEETPIVATMVKTLRSSTETALMVLAIE